jgi:hypothetical protein
MEFLYWHIKYHTTHYEPCGGETISKKFEFFFRLGLPFHSTSTGTRLFFFANKLPPLAQDMVLNHTFNLQAKDKLFSLQDYLLLNYDMSFFCFL